MTAKLDDRDRPVDERLPEPIDDAHRLRVKTGLEDIREGRLATLEDVEAAYARLSRRTR